MRAEGGRNRPVLVMSSHSLTLDIRKRRDSTCRGLSASAVSICLSREGHPTGLALEAGSLGALHVHLAMFHQFVLGFEGCTASVTLVLLTE